MNKQNEINHAQINSKSLCADVALTASWAPQTLLISYLLDTRYSFLLFVLRFG